jgi:hypothetical protein
VVLVHEMAASWVFVEVTIAGVGTIDHVAPFHASASAVISAPPVYPTAMHHDVATQDTPSS